MNASNKDKEPTEKEVAKRADAGLRALLKMPPKPHDEIAGKRKPTKKEKSAKQAKRPKG